MILWTDKTAVEATHGKAQGPSWQASRVEIDSRRVKAGDLFVALKGEKFDGHDFVKDALSKGAAAALVSHVPKDVAADAPLLVVKDTQRALEGLGLFSRRRSRAKIVGVTGSVGKTSAKEMLRLVLSAYGRAFATSGNYNNHIGTPLSLANLPPDCDFAVFEMGMNHAGEIKHLTKMVCPEIAVITNVEPVHLEFFDSMEDIARAKAEIFEGVLPGGIAILPADSKYLALLKTEASRQGIKRLITSGENGGADCRLLDYMSTATGGDITAAIQGKILHYQLGAIGKHWALNSVMALAAAHSLGLDDVKTAGTLSDFGELEGRGRLARIPLAGGHATLIDDSYNASPAAMKAAFAKATEVQKNASKKGRKLAALGDMLELGPQAKKLHAGLAKDLQVHSFDAVFTAGSLMKQLHDTLPRAMRAAHVAQAKDLPPLLLKALKPGDVLLVKGSHGSKMYEVVKTLLKPPAAREKKHAV